MIGFSSEYWILQSLCLERIQSFFGDCRSLPYCNCCYFYFSGQGAFEIFRDFQCTSWCWTFQNTSINRPADKLYSKSYPGNLSFGSTGFSRGKSQTCRQWSCSCVGACSCSLFLHFAASSSRQSSDFSERSWTFRLSCTQL